MSYKVFLFRDMDAKGKNYLKKNDCELVISGTEDLTKCKELLQDVDAIFTRNEKIDREMIDMAPGLKVIAKHGVGYDNIDISYATSKGIQVVYVPKGNLESVADMAMLHILACARRLRYSEEEFIKGNYDVRFQVNDTHELRGRTLALIGCGNIGQSVARRAIYGFGMKVIGYDPYANLREDIPISLMDNREQVFAAADYVSVHLPAMVDTIHSIGMDEFKKMKKSAYLINTSRGNILREAELIQALETKEIAGAGLDVFEEEPLGCEHPFIKMSNVIITPHCAGLTKEASENNSYMGAQGIVDVLQGKTPSYPVNKIV